MEKDVEQKEIDKNNVMTSKSTQERFLKAVILSHMIKRHTYHTLRTNGMM
jgi:hypothetical protein